MNKVENWSEEALVGTYLGGLKDAIANNVRMFSPTTLREVIKLARLRDEQLQKQRKMFTPRSYTQPSHSPSPTMTTPEPKKISWEEMKRKRSLGLCFSCDERYAPGHKCRKCQLLLMEGEDIDEEENDVFHEVEEPEITLHALTGWDSPTTLRVLASINRLELVALMNSGSIHNFISEHAATHLNLTFTPIKSFKVKVADGHPLRCWGYYQNVAMTLGAVSFPIDLFVLPLTGLDIVLGI